MKCPLTPRQLQIARLTFVEGWSAKEFGVKLGISDSTVKQHWLNIRKRLKVRRTSQAVLVCFNAGWLDPTQGDQSPITYEDDTVMTDAERVYNWAFDQHLAARDDAEHLEAAKTLTDAAVRGLGKEPHSIPHREGWMDSLVENMRRKAWPADS